MHRWMAVMLLALLVTACGNVIPLPGGALIYIADGGNHRVVRAATMSGLGWAAYGAFGSGTGQFHWPRAVFVRQ